MCAHPDIEHQFSLCSDAHLLHPTHRFFPLPGGGLLWKHSFSPPTPDTLLFAFFVEPGWLALTALFEKKDSGGEGGGGRLMERPEAVLLLTTSSAL